MSQLTQQNLPAVQFASGPVNLPAEIMANMAAMYDESFAGLGGMGFRRIRVGKVGFILQDGQNKETIPFDQLFGVFVGSSPTNHATWYAKDFVPGQEPEEPDLVWNMPQPDSFPDALPHQFRKKINKNGRDVWAFQIARRVAFVLIRNVGGQFFLDTEKPYIMDLSSMSLFGKGMPEQNMYKWSGIRDLCSQYSNTQVQVMPSMFVTKIVVDVNAPSGVVMFMPKRDEAGQLQFLDTNLIISIHDCAQRQSTRDMLKIREKLTLNGASAPVQNAYQPPLGQVADPALTGYPQQVPPVQTMQMPQAPQAYAGTPAPAMQMPQAPQAYAGTPAPAMQMPQAPAQPMQMPMNFGTPAAQPPQQYPSTPVQAPVPVNAPAGADMGTLLQQAQQILNQGGPAPAPVQQPVMSPAQAMPNSAMTPGMMNPALAPQAAQAVFAPAAPVAPASTDPTVAANIANLMSQLGG